MGAKNIESRARLHAALGDPGRLAIVDELKASDRSPKELCDLLGFPSNLLAHHLDVLENAGAIERTRSDGDARRRYVRLSANMIDIVGPVEEPLPTEVLFLCTRNSARSQLAAALWRERTGCRARSAGTHVAEKVHPGAIDAGRRAGLAITGAVPKVLGSIPRGVQVITVCDLVHEELDATTKWWHWSISDPVEPGRPAQFDAAVRELEERIARFTRATKISNSKEGCR